MGILLSPKLAKLSRKDYYREPVLAHYCPACSELHPFWCEEPNSSGAKWTWNGDAFFPTFKDSMNIKIGGGHDRPARVCHYILSAGHIAYCPDSTHILSGTTVELPDIPEIIKTRIEVRERFEEPTLD